ncbi:MAG: insulinase family protein [Ignavibacteria bacterium]|nr:insulinase family protein [Ignavibacteria bacterium]
MLLKAAFILMFFLSKTTARFSVDIEFREFTLPNGLHVILHKDNTNPVVAVNIWYHVGAKDEEKGRTGVAHLFEHMMFQGSENVGKAQHIEYINNAGGTMNGTTNLDRTNYFQTVPSNQLELVLWLESDRMNTLKVTQENFDNQREVVKEEKRQRYDNMPYGNRWIEISKRLFINQPYEWMPIGSMEDLDNAKLEYAQEFYKKYYVPNNAVLVIAGDIDYEETRKLVEKYFGNIQRGADIKRSYGEIIYNQGEIVDTVYDNIKLSAVYIAYKIPGITDKTIPSLNLLSRILGGGKSSRLFNELVYRKKIAKSVSCFVFDNELGGMFVISATAMPDADIDEIENSITSIVEEIHTKLPSEHELNKAKNYVENAIVRNMETVLQKADNLAFYKTFFGDTSEINRVTEKYHLVTAKEISIVSSTYLNRNNRVVLFYKPK